MYTMKYSSAIKNEEFLPFTTLMNLKDIKLSEARQRKIRHDLTNMWTQKEKKDLTHRKRDHGDYQSLVGWGGEGSWRMMAKR